MVQAATVREALGILSRADYLDIRGCAAACLKHIEGSLTPGIGDNGVKVYGQAVEAALELFANQELLPQGQVELDVSRVFSAAKRAVLGHFGDALRTLNTPELRRQLLALPAEAMEALLDSDDFGTDDESSILLLLAIWAEAQGDAADAAALNRLCELVRLAQLSPACMHFVLPALALEHEAGRGWFPIKVLQATSIARIASLGKKDRAAADGLFPAVRQQKWYSTKPRRQCLPKEGLQYNWSISERDLARGPMQPGLVPDGRMRWTAAFDTGAPRPTQIAAAGFEWVVQVQYDRRVAQTGALALLNALPSAYRIGNRSAEQLTCFVNTNASICVYKWTGTTRAVCFREGPKREAKLDHAWRWPKAMPLQGDQPMIPGGPPPVSAWAPYLHEGCISGTLTLRP
ncbi:hypothetical protein GPECTOR_2g1055 [Gonium pectorale]|uniref:BACK domain-containing protein n=1 Tax=Gonium pectorale TaxID=33097 RepID=A0A150H016_GONPE|nr:hypothetical protein GPECTOR_2g1055 [Gonium pectorale]|eukprot:KXZ55506.1 hypothetical protein GPECTOR_2g1055 [Gonium pectorale]